MAMATADILSEGLKQILLFVEAQFCSCSTELRVYLLFGWGHNNSADSGENRGIKMSSVPKNFLIALESYRDNLK